MVGPMGILTFTLLIFLPIYNNLWGWPQMAPEEDEEGKTNKSSPGKQRHSSSGKPGQSTSAKPSQASSVKH